MTAVIDKKVSKKAPQNPLQKTFNRLRKEISLLEEELKEREKLLNQALIFYHDQIVPAKKELVHTLTCFIKALYDYYASSKCSARNEREALKDLMLNRMDRIFSLTKPNEVAPEIRVIFKELEGVSFDEMIADQLSDMKDDISSMFEEEGINLDLSEINASDTEHEIMRKMFEAMQKAKSEEEMDDTKEAPKSKKELEKEKKAKELEELQNKDLSTIYKQLAKVFHPDLEQVTELKAEKEQLMKRLTSAYDNDDLHTLLSLQMEWMSQTNNQTVAQTREQLKIYNSILKEQVKTLKMSIEMAAMNPKYILINQYFNDDGVDGYAFYMMYQKLLAEAADFQELLPDLQGKHAHKQIRSLLRAWDLL